MPSGTFLDLATAGQVGLTLPAGASMAAPEIGHGLTATGGFSFNADRSLDIVGRYGSSAPYDPPGPTLAAMEDLLSGLVLWSGRAAGLAAALPGVRRPGLGGRLILAGAWVLLVLLPDWLVRALQPPWREPVLLVAGGLPSALVVLHQMVARRQQS